MDDINIFRGGTIRTLHATVPLVVSRLLQDLKDPGLRISPKSAIVGSTAAVSAAIARELSRLGFTVAIARGGKDLGIDYGGGRRHVRAAHRKRASGAVRRGCRFRVLARCGAPGKLLMRTGFKPRYDYGTRVLGANPRDIRRMRAAMIGVVIRNRAGRCPYTISAIEYGSGDALVHTYLKHVQTWWDAWINSDQLRAQARLCWAAIKAHIQATPENRRWRKLPGAISALIAVVLEAGWEPESDDCWVAPGGTRFQIDDEHLDADMTEFYDAFEASLWSKIWDSASRGYCGRGLDGGCSLDSMRSLLRRLRKQNPRAAGALLNQVAGGAWVRQRKADAGLIDDPTCACCSQASETDLHRVWTCPSHTHSEDERIKKSQGLKQRAVRGIEQFPSFWIRGLIPASWVPVDPSPQTTPVHAMGEVPANGIAIEPMPGQWLEVFGDASGGRYARQRRFRRVGTAMVVLHARTGGMAVETHAQAIATDSGTKLRAAWLQALPGPRQTTPRGELWAFLNALRYTRGPLRYGADYLGSVHGFEARRHIKGSRTHTDLCREIGELVRDRGAPVEVFHIESHLDATDVVAGRASLRAVIGNTLADEFARISADITEADEGQVNLDSWVESTASLVWGRMLATEAAAHAAEPRDARAVMRGRLRRQRRQQLVEESAHDLVWTQPQEGARGRRVLCKICKQGSSTHSLHRWLKDVPCRQRPWQAQRPAPVKGVRIGGAHVHVSHSTVWIEAQKCWICNACGK